MLSPLGGTPADEDKGRDMIATLKADDTAHRIAAAVPFLEHHAESTGKVGAVGFCWGGGMVNRVAVLAPDLKAAVAYYGASRRPRRCRQSTPRCCCTMPGSTSASNAGIAAYEAALKANNKRFTIYIYPNVNHGFNNDTTQPLRQAGGRSRLEPHRRVPQAAISASRARRAASCIAAGSLHCGRRVGVLYSAIDAPSRRTRADG